jgi:uncharacterized small protein (DUF1192 family)
MWVIALRKYWPQLLMIAGSLALLASVFWIKSQRDDARAERDTLASWQQSVQDKMTVATVDPDKNGQRKRLDPGATLAGLDGLVRDRDDARRSLDTISKETLAAKARADAADATLAQRQAENAKRLAGAQAEIDRLRAVRSTGDAGKDAAQVAADSEAPWKGWR